MARSGAVLWDWQAFFRLQRHGDKPNLWSRFPVELAPDLIVCPHLFDWPASASRRSEVYTCGGRPHAAVFAARGEAHLLVGDLVTPLAANRTLMQLVRDAERLEGRRADEGAGWIQCGRFRMRQLGRLAELRVRLGGADVRAAFMPQHPPEGATELPSVLGALMAGGDNGKTELWNGFTWATIQLGSADKSYAAAQSLSAEIERWTETKATVARDDDFRLPESAREEWLLRPHRQWLTIYVPFARERCLPWRVQAGDFDSPTR